MALPVIAAVAQQTASRAGLSVIFRRLFWFIVAHVVRQKLSKEALKVLSGCDGCKVVRNALSVANPADFQDRDVDVITDLIRFALLNDIELGEDMIAVSTVVDPRLIDAVCSEISFRDVEDIPIDKAWDNYLRIYGRPAKSREAVKRTVIEFFSLLRLNHGLMTRIMSVPHVLRTRFIQDLVFKRIDPSLIESVSLFRYSTRNPILDYLLQRDEHNIAIGYSDPHRFSDDARKRRD